MTYLLTVTFGLCVVYFLFYYLLPFFFEKEIPKVHLRSFLSLVYIIVFSLLTYQISFLIPNIELGNRVVHSLGGGFAGILVCFLVVKNQKLQINKFQFFVMSFLLVTALGVSNEIIEFFLQNFFHLNAAPNINDTWLDLISNTVGIFLGLACLTPFVKKK